MHEIPTKLTVDQQLLVAQAADRFAVEFARVFPLETVQRLMSESQSELEAQPRFTTWLPVLIEQRARDRLRSLPEWGT